MEKAQQKICHFRSVARLSGLAIRIIQLAHATQQPVEDPAMLSFSSNLALFERNEVTHCHTKPAFSFRDEKIRQEVFCPTLMCGRSWTLWLDGFSNVLPASDTSSGTLLMWSDSTARQLLPGCSSLFQDMMSGGL